MFSESHENLCQRWCCFGGHIDVCSLKISQILERAYTSTRVISESISFKLSVEERIRFSVALTSAWFLSSSAAFPFVVVVAPLGRDGILSGIQGMSSQFSLAIPVLLSSLPFGVCFLDFWWSAIREIEKILDKTDFVGYSKGDLIVLSYELAAELEMNWTLIVTVVSNLFI